MEQINGYSRVEIGFAVLFFALVYYLYMVMEVGYFDCWDWVFTTIFFGIAIYIFKYVFVWYSNNWSISEMKQTVVSSP